MDKKHWAEIEASDGHVYFDADISADPDVQKIMIRAQGNLTKEGYWRDMATDLAALVDKLKAEKRRLESAWETAINLYPNLETILPEAEVLDTGSENIPYRNQK